MSAPNQHVAQRLATRVCIIDVLERTGDVMVFGLGESVHDVHRLHLPIRGRNGRGAIGILF